MLLRILRALIAEGHSVVCAEHHLDFIRQADHVVDLVPPGTQQMAGLVCAEGAPAVLAEWAESPTGQCLRELLEAR